MTDQQSNAGQPKWVIGCTAVLAVLVLVFVVLAIFIYVDYGEPESAFPARLAATIEAARGADGTFALGDAIEGDWDEVHLFAPGLAEGAGHIEACLGFAWDQAALIAGHLDDGAPGGFAIVADGAVVDYGWHLVGATPFEMDDWPCGIAPGSDSFRVDSAGAVPRLVRIED